MQAISSYLQQSIFNHITGKATYTAPTGLYVGLCRSYSITYGGTELTASDYSRIKVEFGNLALGIAKNINDVVFNEASTNWGSAQFVCIYDAPVGGNVLFAAVLSPSITINEGNQIIFKSNNITLTLY